MIARTRKTARKRKVLRSLRNLELRPLQPEDAGVHVSKFNPPQRRKKKYNRVRMLRIQAKVRKKKMTSAPGKTDATFAERREVCFAARAALTLPTCSV